MKNASQELRSKLRESGQRMTSQREAVYAVLCEVNTHPTAEELFMAVRAQVPGISLATVYNTLDMLVSSGFASKLSGEGPARYDATCMPHSHARCVQCGRVENLAPESTPDVLRGVPLPKGFEPSSVYIEVEGACAKCAKASRGK